MIKPCKRAFSLKSQILAMTLGCFAILAGSILWVQRSYIRQLKLDELEKVGSLLLASGERETDDLIPGILLKEEHLALKMLLERIASRGDLKEVDFGQPSADFLQKQKGCHVASPRSWVCIDVEKNEVVSYHQAVLDGQILGVLRKVKSGPKYALSEARRPFLTIIGVLMLCLVGLVAGVALFLDRVVRAPLLSLGKILEPALAGEVPLDTPLSRVKEINSVIGQVKELVIRSRDNRARALIGEMAAEVAHDIRSPLAALGVVAEFSPELPEDRKALLRNALQRIRQIADDLLARHAKIGSVNAEEASQPASAAYPDLILPLLEDVVEEKRLSAHGNQIEIRVLPDEAAYQLFAAIVPAELERVVSNLLNNAVESFGPKGGLVEVRLSGSATGIKIEVKDNGGGIAPDVLPRLMEYGFTSGKPGGSGLGLYHAKRRIEAWGGTLQIRSSVGVGTEVVIQLPRCDSPAWHVPELVLAPGSEVAVIDDDRGIHRRWLERLADVIPASQIKHFLSPDAFLAWYRQRDLTTEARLLVDYSFLGETLSGLDLIEREGLGARAFLVTGMHRDKTLLQRCERLGVGLISKSVLEFVPVRVGASQ